MTFISDRIYRDILKNIPIPCVDVIIETNTSFLMIKRLTEPAKNQWWLPGGRVLKNELLVEAAKRKAFEETGIDCRVVRLVHTEETIFETGPWGIPVHSINACFCLKVHNPSEDVAVKLDRYSSEFKWCWSIKRSWNPYVKRCLRAAGW